MDILISFLGGAAVAAIVIFLIMRSSIKRNVQSAIDQTTNSLQLAQMNELTDIRNEKVRLQADLDNANLKIEETKVDAARQIEELRKDWEKRLQKAEEEAVNHSKALLDEREKAHRDSMAAAEKRHNEAISSQQKRFDDIMEKVEAKMKVATEEMLKDRQKEFAESSNNNLGQIVNPLKETIREMKQAMADSTQSQTKMSAEMRTNLEHVMRQSKAAQESADELARVFKHGSKIQGDWGETVLEELLSMQGLTRGVHFDTQLTMRDARGNLIHTDENSLLRPDVILHLDSRRELIIDSKVSMSAFIDYVNAENEADRERYLKAHILSLQNHVRELSRKDYSAYVQPPKIRMDYVIMFVPNTAALWAAMNVQPDLWRRAMEQNVFIADEQTLYAALRIINMTWTQISQAQNHEKVYQLAEEMINRVGQFIKAYEKVGKSLTDAQKAYEDGSRKLSPQGQSILTTAGQLLKLGARNSAKNPIPELTDVEDIPALPTVTVEDNKSEVSIM